MPTFDFFFLGPLDQLGLDEVASERKQWFSKVTFLLHNVKPRDKEDKAGAGTPGSPVCPSRCSTILKTWPLPSDVRMA